MKPGPVTASSASVTSVAAVVATTALTVAAAALCPPPPPTSGDIPRLRYADLVCSASPPCPADLNGDHLVDVFDLLSYLDLWFALEAEADLNADAAVDVFDLLQYLDGWFNGCP